MKDLKAILAMLALAGSTSFAVAQTAPPEDDCKEQSATDDDACAPAVVLGGLNDVGLVLGIGALALVALAGGSSGSHSGSH